MLERLTPTVARLQEHLRAVSRRYSEAWRHAEQLRAERRCFGGWPDWCYLPLAGAYEIAASTESQAQAVDVAIIAALVAWRATQGIFVFDETVLEAVWDTPLDGEIPSDVLYRLPEWCVYVPLPENRRPVYAWADGTKGRAAGYWAHLEYFIPRQEAELRLLIDVPDDEGRPAYLAPVAVVLGLGSLQAGVEAAVAGALSEAGRDAQEAKPATDLVRPMVSLLLYICSQSAEVQDSRGKRVKPGPVTTSKGKPTVPSYQTMWKVGYDLGAALRAAQAADYAAPTETGRAPPRPHIRRAHWHTYLLGPRDKSQRRDLRWIPPRAVGAGELLPTKHVVR